MEYKRFNRAGRYIVAILALIVLTGCQKQSIEVPEGYSGFTVNNVEFVLPSDNLWTTQNKVTDTSIAIYQDNSLCAVVSNKPYSSSASFSKVYDLINSPKDKEAQTNAYGEYLSSLQFSNPEMTPKNVIFEIRRDVVLVKTEWDPAVLKKKFDNRTSDKLMLEASQPGPYNIEVFGPDGKYMLIQLTDKRAFELATLTGSSMSDTLSISCAGPGGMNPLYKLGESKEAAMKKIEEENKKKEEARKKEAEEKKKVEEEKAEKMKNLDDEVVKQEIHHLGSWIDIGDPQYPSLYPPSLCVSKIVNNTDKTIRECTIAFAAWDKNGMYVNIEERYGSRKSAEFLGLYDIHIEPNSSVNLGINHCWQITDRGNMIDTVKAIVSQATFHDGTTWENPMYNLWREKYLRVNLE